MTSQNFSAQGTIEYLVIIAVIVVLSLLAVGLFAGVTSSPSQSISSSSSKAGEVAAGGISVVESVVDSQGDSLIKLSNNSSDAITLTKISAGQVESEYNEQLVGLDSKVFDLSGLSNACPCTDDQKSVKCEFKIQYTTATGIIKTEYRTVNVQCVNDSTAAQEDNVVKSTALTPPAVSLISPSGNTSSRMVDFVFNLTQTNPVQSCTLKAGNDLNTYTGIVNGSNTVRYTFSSDKAFDWNISCIDINSNIGTSDNFSLDVDANAYQITTCAELQDMDLNLTGNYSLMQDIDCGADTNNSSGSLWNAGLGFEPVGTNASGLMFKGTLNGNYHTIKNLYINRPSQDYVGLFGYGGFYSYIKNLLLFDVNITGKNYVGGIIGATMQDVTYSYASGKVRGTDYVGGITGRSLGLMSYCYSSATVIGSNNVGGLVGYEGLNFFNNYSTGSVSGASSVGGIIGYANYSAIYNNYSSAIVTGASNVGSLIGYDYKSAVRNNYTTGLASASGSYVGGLVGYKLGPAIDTVMNNYYLQGSSCCGGGDCNDCIQETNLSNFYTHNGTAHAVYYNAFRPWDNNWVWSGSSLPTFYWQ